MKLPKITLRGRAGMMVLVLGLAAAGVAGGSAATLGAINARSIGSSGSVVTSCDTNGLTLDYTYTYDLASARYNATTVTAAGINSACNGQTLRITVTDGTTSASGSTTVSGAPADQAVTLAPSTLSAIIADQVVVQIKTG